MFHNQMGPKDRNCCPIFILFYWHSTKHLWSFAGSLVYLSIYLSFLIDTFLINFSL